MSLGEELREETQEVFKKFFLVLGLGRKEQVQGPEHLPLVVVRGLWGC